jgi:uncharacterized membrane protein YkoI
MRFSVVRRRLTAGMLAGLAAVLVPCGMAVADEPADHERARRALEAGEVMPLRTVLEQVERDYPGEVLEVELDREDGAWVYEIKLIRKGGDVLKLELDARDASLRSVRGRDVRAVGNGTEAR